MADFRQIVPVDLMIIRLFQVDKPSVAVVDIILPKP
jgi:hypothetical protein